MSYLRQCSLTILAKVLGWPSRNARTNRSCTSGFSFRAWIARPSQSKRWRLILGPFSITLVGRGVSFPQAANGWLSLKAAFQILKCFPVPGSTGLPPRI